MPCEYELHDIQIQYNTKVWESGFFLWQSTEINFYNLYIKMIKWDIKCKYNLMMQ